MLPVSVVIPCYRCAGTVERAVASVRGQTRPPAELVFVDDASDDGSVDALEKLISGGIAMLRARVVRLARNSGPSAARNAGWDAAAEKYVAFLDADASWHPQKLEVQYEYMERQPGVPVSGHLRFVIPEAIERAPLNGWPEVAYLGFRDLLWTNPIAPSSIMVRRTFAARFPEDLRRMEDQRFLLDLTRAGHRLALLKARLAAHHKPDFGAGGLSADLFAMEKAELDNYRTLYRDRALSAPLLAALSAWSLAKVVRRLAIVGVRRVTSAL